MKKHHITHVIPNLSIFLSIKSRMHSIWLNIRALLMAGRRGPLPGAKPTQVASDENLMVANNRYMVSALWVCLTDNSSKNVSHHQHFGCACETRPPSEWVVCVCTVHIQLSYADIVSVIESWTFQFCQCRALPLQIKYYVINHSHTTFIVVMEWTAELRATKSLLRRSSQCEKLLPLASAAPYCCWFDEDVDLAKLKSFDICINFLLQCTNWSSFIHLFVSVYRLLWPDVVCIHSS